MILNKKDATGKQKRSAASIVFYVAASIVAVVAIALLINDIVMFRSIVNQYVSQGYNAAIVVKQLTTSQLLPGVFQVVGLYGGIAVVLVAAGIINQKVSNCLLLLTEAEACEDAAEKRGPEEDVVYEENVHVDGDVKAEQTEENSEEADEGENSSK